MASAEVLDFGPLLNPIPGDNPAGKSLRYEGIYDAIQEARREEDVLPMGEWQREVKIADWRKVIGIGIDAISNQSKDLQIAAWMVEALVRQNGIPGLRDGLKLLRELQENFWDGLFPELEDSGVEFRAGPLNWLNEKIPPYIRVVPLTNGDPAYGWQHWDESRTIDNLGRQNPEAMQAALAEGKITGERFDKAVESTPRAMYEVLFEDLTQTKEQLAQLENIVDQKFGRNPPSLIKVRNALDDCYGVVEGIVKKKRAQDPSFKEHGNLALDNEANPNPKPGEAFNWTAEPRNREEAFQRLTVIAGYLKRVEPQHPVSYLLERAVSWSKMPLDQWLGEVISNQDVLNNLRETLGIKARDNA